MFTIVSRFTGAEVLTEKETFTKCQIYKTDWSKLVAKKTHQSSGQNTSQDMLAAKGYLIQDFPREAHSSFSPVLIPCVVSNGHAV